MTDVAGVADRAAADGRRSTQNLLTRADRAGQRKFYDSRFWQARTIYDLARTHAQDHPASPALRDRFGVLTYRDLVQRADRLAASLEKAGVRPGERVASWLSTRLETAALLLACSRNGYVHCPSLHRNHTVSEVSALLKRMRARVFFGEAGHGADAGRADIFAEASGLRHLGCIERLDPPAGHRVEPLPVDGASYLGAGDADDVVYLAFTSGTTGEPKGVMHSNNTLLANARALAADWKFDRTSVIYSLSPLSHNLGFGAMVLSFLVGGELVLHDLPKGESLLGRLRQTGATFVFGVPTHAMDLLDEIERSPQADLSRLKGFRISGAAVSPAIVEKLLACGITPQSGYGMTEACSHHYTLPGDAPAVIASTSGRACPGYEVKIFSADDLDRPVPTGTVGHIGGRGASLMLGYFDDQLATEAAFNRDGWFMTGDLGKLDDHGYLQITGRVKDVIIRGGHNIHPARIEMLAMLHPLVERAAAVPVKDERLGEKVCIVVEAKNGNKIDASDLLSHLNAKGLSKYDMPEYFLQVDAIPLSASGKMVKRLLTDPADGGAFEPQPVRWSS